jgi:hypothetical protein
MISFPNLFEKKRVGARRYLSHGSISCSLGLHLVILWDGLFALTLAAKLARTRISKLCFSNMVTFWNPRGPVHHPRMARMNVLTKQLVTLSALCFAVRTPLPNSGNTRFIFSCAFTLPPPHGKDTISPYQKATLRLPDLSRLRTFRCRIYALSIRRRQGKVTTDNVICGKLLGYGGSMKNFIYINNAIRKIGRATHASFDEAQLSTPVADLNSNSLALWGALNQNPGTTAPPVDEILTPPTQFCVFAEESPFLRVATVVIPLKCNFDSLGLILEEDPMSHRNIIADVRKFSSVSQVDWQELLQFRTIIQVDATPVFSVKEAIAQFGRC